MTDDEEKQLKQELLMLDLDLRRKQTFWETPRNLALVVGAVVALSGLIFGLVGYRIGQTPSQPIIINVPAQK
jgi:hypothetical protein